MRGRGSRTTAMRDDQGHEGGDRIADGPQGERPEEGHVVRDEARPRRRVPGRATTRSRRAATGSRRRRSGTRRDFPGTSTGPPAGMNGSHRTTTTPRPIRPVRTSSRQPPVAQNHAANGRMNGSACGLVIRRHRHQGGGRPVVAVDREDDGPQGRQQVDRLVLAPPGGDIEDGRVEEHRDPADDRPGRACAQGVDHERGEAQVGQGRRCLHQGPDGRIGGIGDGLEGRLDRPPGCPRCRP